MELGEHVDIGCNEAKLNIVFHSPFLKIKQSTFYVLIFTKKLALNIAVRAFTFDKIIMNDVFVNRGNF